MASDLEAMASNLLGLKPNSDGQMSCYSCFIIPRVLHAFLFTFRLPEHVSQG